jgi:hypothetical protein
VENPHGVSRGVCTLELDGAPADRAAGIALTKDEGVHRVRAVLGSGKPKP